MPGLMSALLEKIKDNGISSGVEIIKNFKEYAKKLEEVFKETGSISAKAKVQNSEINNKFLDIAKKGLPSKEFKGALLACYSKQEILKKLDNMKPDILTKSVPLTKTLGNLPDWNQVKSDLESLLHHADLKDFYDLQNFLGNTINSWTKDNRKTFVETFNKTYTEAVKTYTDNDNVKNTFLNEIAKGLRTKKSNEIAKGLRTKKSKVNANDIDKAITNIMTDAKKVADAYKEKVLLAEEKYTKLKNLANDDNVVEKLQDPNFPSEKIWALSGNVDFFKKLVEIYKNAEKNQITTYKNDIEIAEKKYNEAEEKQKQAKEKYEKLVSPSQEDAPPPAPGEESTESKNLKKAWKELSKAEKDATSAKNELETAKNKIDSYKKALAQALTKIINDNKFTQPDEKNIENLVKFAHDNALKDLKNPPKIEVEQKVNVPPQMGYGNIDPLKILKKLKITGKDLKK